MNTKESHDTVVEPEVQVDLAFRTDPGRDPEKQVNEDSGFHTVTRFGTLCVVCDGMGGHANGQDASQAAIAAIQQTFAEAPEGSVGRDLLRTGITLGHERIRALPLAQGEGRSGSTVVAVLLTPHGAEVAHVGDSRVHFVSRGRITQVTRDHSMVQLMVEAGMIKPEEAATHPDANKIMRALGIATTVEVDLRPEPLPFSQGDVFVLSSDGLTDLVTEAEILQMASTMPGEQAVGQLVDLANARGGHDNITVLLARPREASHSHAPPSGASHAVPVTAMDPPLDSTELGGRSSPLTVLAAPLPLPGAGVPQASPATAMAAPLPLPGVGMPQGPGSSAQPPFVPTAPPSRPRRQGTSPVVVGLVALLVMGILGAVAVFLYKTLEKPKRQDPQIVVPLSALPFLGEASGAPSATTELVAPEVPVETPPLAPPPGSHHHHRHKDGGSPATAPTGSGPAPK
jgi:PPM family protein phosphatase